MEKRFWVYKHNAEADLLENRGTFDTVEEAIAEACATLVGVDYDGEKETIRIVDNALDSTTIWKAGPV